MENENAAARSGGGRGIANKLLAGLRLGVVGTVFLACKQSPCLVGRPAKLLFLLLRRSRDGPGGQLGGTTVSTGWPCVPLLGNRHVRMHLKSCTVPSRVSHACHEMNTVCLTCAGPPPRPNAMLQLQARRQEKNARRCCLGEKNLIESEPTSPTKRPGPYQPAPPAGLHSRRGCGGSGSGWRRDSYWVPGASCGSCKLRRGPQKCRGGGSIPALVRGESIPARPPASGSRLLLLLLRLPLRLLLNLTCAQHSAPQHAACKSQAAHASRSSPTHAAGTAAGTLLRAAKGVRASLGSLASLAAGNWPHSRAERRTSINDNMQPAQDPPLAYPGQRQEASYNRQA
jgi:hypothetical protein